MSKQLKTLPHFHTEDEEREFWATHSSEDYVDFDKLVSVPAPHIPKTADAVFLRLPHDLFEQIDKLSREQKIPAENLIREILALSFKSNIAQQVRAH